MAMIQKSTPNGQGTLRLLNFVDQLGKFNVSLGQDPLIYTANTIQSTRGGEINSIGHWQAFVDKFFTETGSFINIVCAFKGGDTKMFDIVHAALPRYFYTQFNTEVENLQITLDGSTEKVSSTETKVSCDRAKLIYTYRNQCQVSFVMLAK